MKRRIGAAALAILLLWTSPALARDSFGEERPSEPAPDPERDFDPAPFIAPPPGVYYVTDTYIADVVTSNGPVTTYSTATVHESTGSYARVLDTVGTGESSYFDGSAFNGRRRLGDGRLVAGTYYENYLLTAAGFEAVSIVFFQDDAEITRVLAGTPGPTVPSRELLTASPTTRPLAPACCLSLRPVAEAGPTQSSTTPIRPGLSVLPSSAPLRMLEVLRGRAISLWPRAFVDDHEVPVRSWTLIAGDAGEALARAGTGAVAFRSSWLRLAPPGAAYQLVFRIELDTPETGHRTVDATIAVVVRSPALED